SPGADGHLLRCGPDIESFAAAHPAVTLGEVFSRGPEALRFGLLRALLDDGAQDALAAVVASPPPGQGSWHEAQQLWEASRQFDGELPALPATRWREFQIAVLRRLLDVVSTGREPALETACEGETIAWTMGAWAVIPRGAPVFPAPSPLLQPFSF